MSMKMENRATAERDSDAAYGLLLERIVDLSIPPGALLNEQSLAADLDYGRTPVREALARLVADRFVTVLPRQGVIVAPITFEDVLAMFEARETIECGIAYIDRKSHTSELQSPQYLVCRLLL